MDFIDAVINFLNVTDSTSLLKKNFEILKGKDEYPGERIKAFLSLFILLICYIAILIGLIYILSIFIKNK